MPHAIKINVCNMFKNLKVCRSKRIALSKRRTFQAQEISSRKIAKKKIYVMPKNSNHNSNLNLWKPLFAFVIKKY